MLGGIGKTIGGVFGGVAPAIGSVIRQTNPYEPLSQLIGDRLDPNGANEGKSDMPPPVDPRLAQMRDQQLQQAKSFRTELPTYKDSQFNAAADASRRALAGEVAGVRRSANSRGLLYSGLRQGAEAAASGNAAAALAKRRVAINQESNDRADALDNQALQSGLAIQGLEQNRLDTAYDRALGRQKAKAAAQSSFASGAGGLLGSLGKRKQRQDDSFDE